MPINEAEALKEKVQEFWNRNPCAINTSSQPAATRAYFDEVEQFRYNLQTEQKDYVGFSKTKSLKVLEIGCGLGTDGRQFAQAGAFYTGVDLTEAAIGMARRNFETHGLIGTFKQGDGENLPFEEGSFDLVYSYGVLHHTPNMEKAFRSVNRVLKPGGRFIVMVYHKSSWNYYVNIMLIRRLGAVLLLIPGGPSLVAKLTGEPVDRLVMHRNSLRKEGFNYLRKSEFLSQNTDGPGNPLSHVYNAKELQAILRETGFQEITTKIGFLHKRWIPLVGRWLTSGTETFLARRYGWHLYGFARKP